MRSKLLGVSLVAALLLAASCGSDSGSSTPVSPTPSPSPAPTPAPAPSPAPSPSPAPAEAALSSISVTPASVQGQQTASATVTLTAAAPAGGAVIDLQSSEFRIAVVPAQITVAAGSTQRTFDVTTSTVTSSSAVTLTARYAGVSKDTTLTVTPPPLTPTFTVTSSSRGADACVIIEDGTELDCLFNATGSGGFIRRYLWTYVIGSNTLTHSTLDAESRPDVSSGCTVFQGASKGRDSAGNQYLEMNLSLQLEDAQGNRSSNIARRVIKVYPDARCGYDF